MLHQKCRQIIFGALGSSLFALDIHHRTLVIVPALEEVVNRSNDHDGAQHGRGPVPEETPMVSVHSEDDYYCMADSHVFLGDRVVQRPDIEEQHRCRQAE